MKTRLVVYPFALAICLAMLPSLFTETAGSVRCGIDNEPHLELGSLDLPESVREEVRAHEEQHAKDLQGACWQKSLLATVSPGGRLRMEARGFCAGAMVAIQYGATPEGEKQDILYALEQYRFIRWLHSPEEREEVLLSICPALDS